MAYWIQRSFGSAYAIRARFILKDNERNVSLNEAVPLPIQLIPKEASLESSHKSLPNIFMLCGCWCVSELFHDLIEQLEPGIHQFFKIKIKSKAGVYLDDTNFYLINILNCFDALVVSESNVEWVDIDAVPPLKSLRLAPGEPKLTMSAPKIDGRHIWRNELLLPEAVYCSDALIHEFKKNGLKSNEIRSTKVNETFEEWDPEQNLKYYLNQVPGLRDRYRKLT